MHFELINETPKAKLIFNAVIYCCYFRIFGLLNLNAQGGGHLKVMTI